MISNTTVQDDDYIDDDDDDEKKEVENFLVLIVKTIARTAVAIKNTGKEIK